MKEVYKIFRKVLDIIQHTITGILTIISLILIVTMTQSCERSETQNTSFSKEFTESLKDYKSIFVSEEKKEKKSNVIIK